MKSALKDGTPVTYSRYRNLWSSLHVVLLVVVGLLLVGWLLHDANGVHLVQGWWSWSSGVQRALWHLIPFPWALA